MPLGTKVQRKWKHDSFQGILQTSGVECKLLEITRVYMGVRDVDLSLRTIFLSSLMRIISQSQSSRNNKVFICSQLNCFFEENNNFSPSEFNNFRATFIAIPREI